MLIAGANTKLRSPQEKNRAARIKAELVRQGLTVTALALELGHARNSVSIAINRNRLPDIRAKVLARLGMSK